jgi:hypothetical protein
VAVQFRLNLTYEPSTAGIIQNYIPFLRTLSFKRPPDQILSRASNRGGIQWTTIFTDPSSTRIRNNPIRSSRRCQIQSQSNNSQASYLYETCSLLLGSDNYFFELKAMLDSCDASDDGWYLIPNNANRYERGVSAWYSSVRQLLRISLIEKKLKPLSLLEFSKSLSTNPAPDI